MPQNILFIEDEPALQKTIGEVLQNGYNMLSAMDGEEGIKMAKEKNRI